LRNFSTREKKTRYTTERDTEEVQEQRHVYQEKVSTLGAKDLVFWDETGINIAMTQ
jgi:hypothetical protein